MGHGPAINRIVRSDRGRLGCSLGGSGLQVGLNFGLVGISFGSLARNNVLEFRFRIILINYPS